MSDIGKAGGQLLTPAEWDAEIQKIDGRINKISAILGQSKLPLEDKIVHELKEFIKLLEKCKDTMKELKDVRTGVARKTPEEYDTLDFEKGLELGMKSLNIESGSQLKTPTMLASETACEKSST